MYNVGPYTMAEWKVVWREQSSTFQAAVVGTSNERVILPDHKLMLVPCTGAQEARYLTAMLNSSPSLVAIVSYVISTSTSTHVLKNIAVPKFNPSSAVHGRLTALSQQGHEEVGRGNPDALRKIEREIDELAAQLWSITPAELEAIRDALGEN